MGSMIRRRAAKNATSNMSQLIKVNLTYLPGPHPRRIIFFRRFDRGMAEEHRDYIDRNALREEIDAERVPETVRVTVRNAGKFVHQL